MHSKARARSPHSTTKRVSRALGSAKLEVSCLHTRRQWVQAKRRRRTSSCVGRHPTGTCAKLRDTVPRDTPWALQALQNGSSNPICMRHSTIARPGVRHCPTVVNPGASSPRKVVRSGSVKVVSGTSRSLNWVDIAAPITRGPRPLPTQRRIHQPHPEHINRHRLIHPQMRRAENPSVLRRTRPP